MLVPSFTLGSLDLTAYPYAVEFGSDLGSPEVVYEVLLSALADGEAVTSERTSNRQIEVTVHVEGPDMSALADAEAALIAETEKIRNTLVIDPGDEVGPPTAFDTFRAQAVLVRDDDEEQSLLRRYALTIPAYPFGRSVDPVEIPAAPSTPTYTEVDDGSALSGPGFSWALSAGDVSEGLTLTTDGTRLTIAKAGGDPGTFSITRTAATFPEGNYFTVDVSTTGGYVLDTIDGWQLVAQIDVGGGVTRFFFIRPVGMTNLIMIFRGSGPAGGTVSIELVQIADSVPYIGTPKQRLISAIPGGSVRTQGSIIVENDTTNLDDVIVFTHPSEGAYVPALSALASTMGGNTRSADATAVSGESANILKGTSDGGGVEYYVPVDKIPQGTGQIWARVKAATDGDYDIEVSVAPYLSSSIITEYEFTATVTVTLTAGVWTIVPLASVPMPPARLGSTGKVRFAISQPDLTLDETWLFALDRGALTVITPDQSLTYNLGGPAARLFIDAPSVDDPTGGVYTGNAADRSDTIFSTAIDSFMDHNFDPEGVSVFVVTTGVDNADTSLSFYRRWHTSAGS